MLTPEQLDTFNQDGALVVPSVVDQETIATIRRAFEQRVDDIIARSCRLGDMMPLADDASFDEKMTALIRTVPQHYQHLDISLPMMSDLASQQQQWQRLFADDWRQEAGFFGDDAIFNLVTHPQIKAITRQIIGDSVCLSPVQHVRIKPPQHLIPKESINDANIARTLWHQDEAVVTEDARVSPILTVWLAVTDATIENGCMYAVRGSHQENHSANDFGLVRHCPGRPVSEIYIPEEAINRDHLIPLLAKSGDAVLLHRRTVHGAGTNESAHVRWSFDLRYQPIGTPSGRHCFPSFVIHGDHPIASGEDYRRQWRQARDNILDGSVSAVFNDRWNKYADLCA